MTKLKYITLNQLMASVESDFSSYADNGMIDRGKVIKIVRKVNEDVGLKIFKEKETVIDIQNFKGELPEDFMLLQLALVCNAESYTLNLPGSVLGTHTEEHVHVVPTNTYCNTGACLESRNGCYWVTQTYKNKTIKYSNLQPVRITQRGLNVCSDNCPNQKWNKGLYEVDIDNGQITTGFREGKLYINYLSDMVNENGELLLLDHALVQPYYEYAIKKHLIENWMVNKQADVYNLLPYYKNELKEARIAALNFTETIEYTEIQDVYRINRLRFYNRYHKMFDDAGY